MGLIFHISAILNTSISTSFSYNNPLNRERCGVCQKFVYTHNSVVVCSLDGEIYHSKCLGFTNKVASDIRQINDWFCPICVRSFTPFFTDGYDLDQSLYVSPKPDDSCLDTSTTSNNTIYNDYNVFNPYLVTANSNNDIFDFDSDNDEDTDSAAQIASIILSNCNVISPAKLCIKQSHTNIYYHNIDGFKTNFNEFCINLHLFDGSLKFDIFCFVETNLHEYDDLHYFDIPNYHSYHLYAIEEKSKGSGISIYYHNNTCFNTIRSLNFRNDYFECLGGALATDFGTCNLVIIYRFNKSVGDEFFKSLEDLLENYASSPCMFIGDFNLNCFNFHSDRHVSRYCELLFSYGLSPLISRSTNILNSSSTLIDQIWSNFFSESTSTHVIDSSISTHRPLVLSLSLTINDYIDTGGNEVDPTRLFHNVSAKNCDRFAADFNDYISTFSNNYLHSDNTATVNFSHFFSTFDKMYTDHIVEELDPSNKRNCLYKPWITIGISKSCSVKNNLYSSWVRSRGSPAESLKKQLYTSYRGKLRDIIRLRQTEYFTDKFDKSKGNIKKSWQVINEIRHKNTGLITPDRIIDNGEVITNRRLICKHFNNYFISIASRLNSDKYDNYTGQVPDFKDFLKNPVSNSIYLNPILETEIGDIINSLKTNKTSDYSPRLLKLFNRQFSYLLAILFNNCISDGVFPDELKIAKVLPLFKSGDKDCINNYRPISILPIFSKIFEKLIQSRLINFFDKEKVLYDGQFGFRKKRSTIQALNASISNVINSLEKRHKSLGIFIDFSKAFDTIKHAILLEKLYHYGIRGVAWNLMKSYLNNRRQYVYFDQSTFSDLDIISFGVPQGSVLGPLLFIVYINDIVFCQCTCDSVNCTNPDCLSALFILFADDCNIFIDDKDTIVAYRKANDILSGLKSYIDANYLHINIKKTKFVRFRPPRSKESAEDQEALISYDGLDIQQVKSIKFLGVIIEETLNWQPHIDLVCKKVSQIIGTMYQLSRSAPKDMMVSIYNALVQSNLSYGISVWGSGGDRNRLSRLFTLQKKAIRTTFKIKKSNKYILGPTKLSFNSHNILTIHNLYFKEVISETFKIKCLGNQPKILENMFVSSRLNRFRLIVPTTTYLSLKNNFLHTSISIWNSLVSHSSFSINVILNISKFKRFIKKLILNYQATGVQDEWNITNLSLEEFLRSSRA